MSDPYNQAKTKLALDKRRILLIEDDSKLVSTLSSHLFRAEAWDVWQAHNRRRARELWKEHRDAIDVVIADERLPDGRGFELLREFRVDKTDLCCLLISGAPVLDWEVVHCGFLEKPFREDHFISAVNALGAP